MNTYNNKIDVIIPAYNVPDNTLFRCLASIACQDIIDDIEVTIVDDASTVQNYVKVAENFTPVMSINILRYEENMGPGVARQCGIDNTTNGYITFIDADDTFNGSLALRTLRNGIEAENGLYQACVGAFDEILSDDVSSEPGPFLLAHEQDLVWMFGKLYRRSFIDNYDIRFHETSRANEDNGFNTLFYLHTSEKEQINFLAAHVYYWHYNPNSITRINDCSYSYGSSERDSFYGYVENKIYAITEARRSNPQNMEITRCAISCMLKLYEYYIECVARSSDNAEANFNWCKRFYNEVYKSIEQDVTEEVLATYYSELMKGFYTSGALDGIIPCMSLYEFLDKLKLEN